MTTFWIEICLTKLRHRYWSLPLSFNIWSNSKKKSSLCSHTILFCKFNVHCFFIFSLRVIKSVFQDNTTEPNFYFCVKLHGFNFTNNMVNADFGKNKVCPISSYRKKKICITLKKRDTKRLIALNTQITPSDRFFCFL